MDKKTMLKEIPRISTLKNWKSLWEKELVKICAQENIDPCSATRLILLLQRIDNTEKMIEEISKQ